LIAAFLGRGTAYALQGVLASAISDFSQAISIDSSCVDAWKRRGQARAAKGFDNDAIFDLTKAATLHPDHEVFHQRGLVYYKQVCTDT
jgi:tetratricopeptide (TPR) repeat protein